MEIFETSLNWYSIPPFIGMFFMLSLAIVSLVSGRRVLLWKMLAIFAFLLSLTAFFAFKVSIATSSAEVLRFARHVPFFALLSVLFGIYYCMILTGRTSHVELFFRRVSLKSYVISVVIIGALIWAGFLKTGIMISDASLLETGTIEISYGPLILIPYLTVVAGFVKILITLIKARRLTEDKTFREFLGLNILAFRAIFGPAMGLLLILPMFGLQTQVYAFIAFPIAVVIFYIAIVRYQFSIVDDLNRGLERKVEERTAELKQTQAKLVQAEKMASLGLLAAGVAHEVNNPIGAVRSMHYSLISALTYIKKYLPKSTGDSAADEKLVTSLKVIDDANKVIDDGTKRVVEIVKSLKSFSRVDQAKMQWADIHIGLDDTLKLVAHEAKDRIVIEKQYGDIPEIFCAPGLLNQVFLNIIINAIQAIEGKGKIFISTEIAGENVIIIIRDNGNGISPDNLTRIFEPGFTTKRAGVGTGLGLAICYQIIEDHHGEIKASSEIGKGTEFMITLPINQPLSN